MRNLNRINFIFLIILLHSCQDQTLITREINTNLYTYNDCIEKSDTCTYVKYSYPVLRIANNKVLESKLNSHINSFLLTPLFGESNSKSIDESVQDFFDEYELMKNELQDYNIPWALEKDIVIENTMKNSISISSLIYSFTGGAHPNTFKSLYSFNLIDGNEILLNNIIDTTKYDSFINYAEKSFRNSLNIHADSSFQSAGYWFDDGFYLPENFMIVESGLYFLYNAYEIAPYALGATELKLQFPNFEEYLSEDINYWEQ
jgi:hypothetical protein